MFKLKEETTFYQNQSYESSHLIWNLLSNAFSAIQSVYLFKNFDEYSRQLISDDSKDKGAIYWNASYYEKLIDYIKISLAFETFNKAILLNQGYVVHNIDKKFSRNLSRQQTSGKPVAVTEFLSLNYSEIDFREKTAELNGLERRYATINYSHTLNPHYQEIIQLDKQLVWELQKINQKRNRLHFYTDFTGAFSVHDHLNKWKYIMDVSNRIIKEELIKYENDLTYMKLPSYETF
jgi:hypothetical protein